MIIFIFYCIIKYMYFAQIRAATRFVTCDNGSTNNFLEVEKHDKVGFPEEVIY